MPHNIDDFPGQSTPTPRSSVGIGGDTAEARRQAAVAAFGSGEDVDPDQEFDLLGLPIDDDDDGDDAFDPEFWQSALWAFIQDEAGAQAEALGLTEFEFSSLMGASRDSVWEWSSRFMEALTREPGRTFEYYTRDPQGISLIFSSSWNQFRSLNPVFGALSGGSAARTTGGRGSGARAPTSQDIRNRYDIDELSQNADTIWRNMLMTTPKSSRSIAKAYVDEIVRTKGEKALNFRAYVRRRAMDSNRFAVIYENKPEGLEPEEYLARYAGVASQVVRPGNVEELAIAGARIGSDQQTFSARLGRTNEVTGSAPFINGLENRMRSLSKVFRG